jgi:hypothetical protein
MIKLVNESIDSYVAETKETRSYETPMTDETMRSLIQKVLIKFQREGGRKIMNMTGWLDINGIGSYSHNRWVKAMVDTLFKYTGGVWLPINQDKSLSELTTMAMTYWDRKLKKKNDIK